MTLEKQAIRQLICLGKLGPDSGADRSSVSACLFEGLQYCSGPSLSFAWQILESSEAVSRSTDWTWGPSEWDKAG